MRDAVRELWTAARAVRRRAGASAVVVATLALGIGANAAIFSVVRAVLLAPLPYPDSAALVSIWGRFLPSSGYDFATFSLSEPEVLDYRSQTTRLAGVGAYTLRSVNVATPGAPPERLRAGRVTAEVFDVLGVDPALGRAFAAEEGLPGAPPVAVLGHRQWVERFAADPDVLSRSLVVDATPTRIVGVMPPGFAFPGAAGAEPDLWLPLPLDPASPGDRDSHALMAIGRLAPGVTLAEASAEMETLMARWARDFPEVHGVGHDLYLVPFRDDVVGEARTPLLVLFGAAGLVLAIACVNVGNVLLAQHEERRREMALRAALGGSRGRLVRQLLTEGLLLALVGGGLAVLLAVHGLPLLLAVLPESLPHRDLVTVDAATSAFAAALTLAAVAVFALLPALRGTAVRPLDALRAGGRGGAATSRGDVRLRQGLIVVEVALGVGVVLAASLLAQTHRNLGRRDPGFAPAGVLAASLALPEAAYDPAAARAFYAELLERVATLPGVETAGVLSSLPLRDGAPPDDFLIEGRTPPVAPSPSWNADFVTVSAGTLPALGVPVLRGRGIAPGDVRGAPLVAVVNRAAAERYWPGEDPVGRRLTWHGEGDPWVTVVGVVGDVRGRSLREEPRPAIYVPHAQAPREGPYPGLAMTLVVRAGGDPTAIAPDLRALVGALDPDLPLMRVTTMDAVVDAVLGPSRSTSRLMGAFAVVALFLAAIGVYGVVSFSVRRRRPEIGIRLALGARRLDVVRQVAGEGLAQAALGVVLGLVLARLGSRLLAGLLFGVEAADPATHVAVAALLLAVTLLASARPALHAARIDPARTLRGE